jgi:rubrerythrin
MASSVGSIEAKRNPVYENNQKKQNYFLICESCFWCASSLSTAHRHLIKDETICKCPSCDSDRIRLIPIFLRDL